MKDCVVCRVVETYKDVTVRCSGCGSANTTIEDAILGKDGNQLIGFCFDCSEPFFVEGGSDE